MESSPPRKLAAILQADVVGYSRLMAEDEAGTLARLKACRRELIEPLIETHRGRPVNFMGDGVLVEFASVIDALQFAVTLQNEMRGSNADVSSDQQINLRIGINLGDVIEDGDDIYGDGVKRRGAARGSIGPWGDLYLRGRALGGGEETRSQL